VFFSGVSGESFNQQETAPDLSVVLWGAFFNSIHSSAWFSGPCSGAQWFINNGGTLTVRCALFCFMLSPVLCDGTLLFLFEGTLLCYIDDIYILIKGSPVPHSWLLRVQGMIRPLWGKNIQLGPWMRHAARQCTSKCTFVDKSFLLQSKSLWHVSPACLPQLAWD
jgi:hypothetical protein